MQLRISSDDMRGSIKNKNPLAMNIVGMLQHDYFDDAVGTFEGFQIFRDLVQHGNGPLQLFLMSWCRMLIHLN